VLVECSQCGAPLETKESSRTAKCNYCGAQNQVRTMKTIAQVTPSGWAPPKVWTPPPGTELQGKRLEYTAQSWIAGIAGFTLLVTVLPIVLMCLVFACVGGMLFWLMSSAGPGMPPRGSLSTHPPALVAPALPPSPRGGEK